jgi:hypothetical protein
MKALGTFTTEQRVGLVQGVDGVKQVGGSAKIVI